MYFKLINCFNLQLLLAVFLIAVNCTYSVIY